LCLDGNDLIDYWKEVYKQHGRNDSEAQYNFGAFASYVAGSFATRKYSALRK
jgi:hypothetical protein